MKYKLKGMGKRIFMGATSSLLAFLSVLIWCGIGWMLRTWANLTMDELAYHMTATLEGTDWGLIRSFLIECALPAAAVMALFIVLNVKKGKKWGGRLIVIGLAATVAAAGVRLWHMDERMGVWEYIKNQGQNSDFILDNYAAPEEVSLTFPEEKRNLVMIFLESMETTYADESSGGSFEENIIPELTKLAQDYEDFSGDSALINGASVMPGCSWTVAAMFAHTAGLPLKITIGDNDMDTQESFFPGITAMGDVLDAAGYRQTLLIGSDAAFGGRDLYFSDHGGYSLKDHPYAIREGMLPEGYEVFWGYEDEKLFKYAKDELLYLADQDEPFNLTMLTVDTHFEDGYICDLCQDEYGWNKYANVMACSSRQVAEFVEWIQAQDFYEDTAIVIVGDHLTMDSNFCFDVPANYNRRTYTAYINAAAEVENPANRREYTGFDTFPTTMAALGVDIEGDRLGLGTNLFSNEMTILERYGENRVGAELNKASLFMYEKAAIFPVRLDDYDKEANALSLYVGDLDQIDETSIEVEITRNGKTSSVIKKNKLTDGDIELTVRLPGVAAADQTITVYAVYGQDRQRMELETLEGYPLKAMDDINEYLEALGGLLKDYSVMIAVMDEATENLTDEIKANLSALGLETDLTGQYRASYCAIITPNGVQEQLGDTRVTMEGVLPDDAICNLVSAGYDAGDYASVIINGREYARQSRGLNIVVYDHVRGYIVDSVCFDTCGDLEAVR